ncbi:Cytidylate kinase [uncultured archaeon]|nr:Cytidylate kinase [uncultured archaeon]
MIICIAGLSGSGKNSVGELVAQKLGLRVVNPTFKTIAKKEKLSLMEFHKKAEHNPAIDKDFDARLVDMASRGDCVVTTWLGPWMIKNADMRIWLYAPRAARAERCAGRDGQTFEEAERHITERDENNHHRYHEIYRINIYDHSGFDLVINTEQFLPEESADIIAIAACAKTHKCTCSCNIKERKDELRTVVRKAAKTAAEKKKAKTKMKRYVILMAGKGCCCCCEEKVVAKKKAVAKKKSKKK